MDYVYATIMPGPHACYLGALQEVEDDYELLQGIPRAKGFPASAHFRMSDDHPRDLLLEDFLFNQNKLLVASPRACDLFERAGVPDTEYLPVRIHDHKGRDIGTPYAIVHQVGLQDAIDEAASEYEENPIDPERLLFVDRLVVDESRVDPGAQLFRLRRFAEVPIFRRDLAEQVKAAALSGLLFKEFEDWDV